MIYLTEFTENLLRNRHILNLLKCVILIFNAGNLIPHLIFIIYLEKLNCLKYVIGRIFQNGGK